MYRPMEWTRDRSRPATKPLGFGVMAGANTTPRSVLQNASATAGLPNTIQAQMPNGRLTSQAGDHGIIATIAAVAATGYQCSRSIFIAPVMSTPDTAMISIPARATITNRMQALPHRQPRPRWLLLPACL